MDHLQNYHRLSRCWHCYGYIGQSQHRDPVRGQGRWRCRRLLLVFFYNPAALVVKREPTDPKLKSKATYYVLSSTFVVDLTKRVPTGDHDSTEKFSEVVVE